MWSGLYRHHLVGFVGIVSHFPFTFSRARMTTFGSVLADEPAAGKRSMLGAALPLSRKSPISILVAVPPEDMLALCNTKTRPAVR
jgi:hypothetical protein